MVNYDFDFANHYIHWNQYMFNIINNTVFIAKTIFIINTIIIILIYRYHSL